MRRGVLVAGGGRSARAYARWIRRSAPDVPCFFWCENMRRARALDSALHGDGWFNSLQAALQDERIALVIVTGRAASQLADVAAADCAGQCVAIPARTFSLEQAQRAVELVKVLCKEDEP